MKYIFLSRVKHVATVLAATFSIAILVMVLGLSRHAMATDDSACATVEVVAARGSGQQVGGSSELNRFRDQLRSSVKQPLTPNFYELGSQKQGSHQYPAVDVGDVRNGNAMGAWISRGNANDYGDSVSEGIDEMILYMSHRYVTCKSAGSKFVLVGYSQGAQVVGQYLAAAPKEIRDQIVFVALFGDPKLHLPEGEGFNPPACRGEQLSSYRRVIANCDVDNGSLGARKPYLPADMHDKTGVWCYANDFVCGSSKIVWDNDGHMQYGKAENAIDTAVYEALQRVRVALPQYQQQYISVKRALGNELGEIDVVMVVDTSGVMASNMDKLRQLIATSAARIQMDGGRVALVSYDKVGDSYVGQLENQLTHGAIYFNHNLENLAPGRGGGGQAGALQAIMAMGDGFDRNGNAARLTVIVTEKGIQQVDTMASAAMGRAAKQSLTDITPYIELLVLSHHDNDFYATAELANIQLPLDPDEASQAFHDAVARRGKKPIALLKNQQYRAEPGQQITFDASDSYAVDDEISRYEWDFDDDGIYDMQTISPIVYYRYTQSFDGYMEVRTTTHSGRSATASAAVSIGTYTKPVVPAAPKYLEITRDDGDSVEMSWQPGDDQAEYWIISSDGVALGKIPSSATSVVVGDLARSKNISLEVTGVMANGMMGASAVVSVVSQQDSQSVPSSIAAISTGSLASAVATPWHEKVVLPASQDYELGGADAPHHSIHTPAILPVNVLGVATVQGNRGLLFSVSIALVVIIALILVGRARLRQ